MFAKLFLVRDTKLTGLLFVFDPVMDGWNGMHSSAPSVKLNRIMYPSGS